MLFSPESETLSLDGVPAPMSISVIGGGASLFGAIGSITGTALGVILIAIMQNGLLLMKISSYWQFVVLGAVVIGAVAIDSVRRQRVWRSNAK